MDERRWRTSEDRATQSMDTVRLSFAITQLHQAVMPTWSMGEKNHEGGGEHCLGSTNLETIGNGRQENAKGEAERCNILTKKTPKAMQLRFYMEHPQHAAHGMEERIFLVIRGETCYRTWIHPGWRRPWMRRRQRSKPSSHHLALSSYLGGIFQTWPMYQGIQLE